MPEEFIEYIHAPGVQTLKLTTRKMTEAEKLEDLGRDIGHTIGGALPEGVGFALLLFNFGPGGTMSWISNAQRPDMIQALEEMIERLKGDSR